jgi:thiamine-phosphate pyrophosphorylase
MRLQGYYFITDHALSRAGNRADVELAVRAGAAAVQYRNKDASTRDMYAEATALRSICRDTLFLVNDRLDIALAVEADGVHLGQDDMPYAAARALLGAKRVIGITVHSVAEAVAAEHAGADYVAASPIFDTATKADAGKPAGITLIEDIKKAVRVPVVAIGGINHGNAGTVVSAGADALCAISAVVAAADPLDALRKFQELYTTKP